jgi:hypothetical protein
MELILFDETDDRVYINLPTRPATRNPEKRAAPVMNGRFFLHPFDTPRDEYEISIDR